MVNNYQRISKGPGSACVRRRGAPVPRYNGQSKPDWSLQHFISVRFSKFTIDKLYVCSLWVLYQSLRDVILSRRRLLHFLHLLPCWTIDACLPGISSIFFFLFNLIIVSPSLPVDSTCNFSFFSAFISWTAFHVAMSVIHLSFFLPLRRPGIVWAAHVTTSWKLMQVFCVSTVSCDAKNWFDNSML